MFAFRAIAGFLAGVLLAVVVPGDSPSTVHSDSVQWIGQTDASLTFRPERLAAAQALCEALTAASGGEIEFVLHAAGEEVAAGTEYQAVEDGDLDFAISGAFLGGNEEELFRLPMNSMSPAMSPTEKLSWYWDDDGSDLLQQWLDASYTDLAFVPASGVMGPAEIFLHSNVPMEAVEDLDGLKVRTAGDAGVVLDRMGASTVFLPGGEIEAAMNTGVIDAFEYSGACLNWEMGCQDWADYVYLSDCRMAHEFAPLIVSKALWEGLDQSTRDDLAEAGQQATRDECTDLVAQDAACVQQFRDYAGCTVLDLPRSVEQEFMREAYPYYRDEAEPAGSLFDEIHISLLRYGLPEEGWLGQADSEVGTPAYDAAQELCDALTAASGGAATFTLVPAWSVCPAGVEAGAVEDGVLDFSLGRLSYGPNDEMVRHLFMTFMGGMTPERKLDWFREEGGNAFMDEWLDTSFAHLCYVPDTGMMGAGEVFLHSSIPISLPRDFEGLDVRAAGEIGEVHSRMGADVVFIRHPNDIKHAMVNGDIDAFEYGGACTNWWEFGDGLQNVAPYVYTSTWGSAHDFAPLLVRKPLWEGLDGSTRDDIAAEGRQATLDLTAELVAQEEACMQQFRDDPDFGVSEASPKVFEAFLTKVRQYYAWKATTEDAFYLEVLESLKDFGMLGIFSAVSGGVTWSGDAEPPEVGDKVYAGTEITTDATGSVELLMVMDEGHCTVGLNPETQVKVSDDPDAELGTIEFFQGKLLAKVRDLPPEGFEVWLPQAVAGSRGTEWMVQGDSTEVVVTVLDGSVDVTTLDETESVVVDAGYEVAATSEGLGDPTATSYEYASAGLEPGWNLVSVPVEHPFSMSAALIFDTIDDLYAWDPETGEYYEPTVIEPCRGYWVVGAGGETVTVAGTPVTEWTQEILAGWNLIGSVSTTTPVSSLFTDADPDPLHTDAVYAWDADTMAYQAGDEIQPGMACWLLTDETCNLTMTAP